MPTQLDPNRHVALLRGINVGGNRLIKMSDLRDSFEAMGFRDVATYIASGNVLFTPAKPAPKAKLCTKIEKVLGDAFGCSRIVLVTAPELAEAVAQAPKGFGKDPEKYRYDVAFVKPPLTAAEALPEVPLKPGVDEAWAGDHAIYLRRLAAKASSSHISKLVTRPVYQSLTLRNWNTTTKLLALVSTDR